MQWAYVAAHPPQCLAEQQTASRGQSGPLPVCRLWSPHTVEEVALIQLPSRHDVLAADFSPNGNLLFLLLSDPQHSLAVYFHLAHVVAQQQQLAAATNNQQKPLNLPLLQPAHVIPCTRSPLNGLTIESVVRTGGGQISFSRGRSRWRQASDAYTPPCGSVQAGDAPRYCSGEGALIRFATFGLGHLRLWSINGERPFQPPPAHVIPCTRSPLNGLSIESVVRTGGGQISFSRGRSRWRQASDAYTPPCGSAQAADAPSGGGGGEAGGGGQRGGPPEATACAFLPSGDVIAALADRRIVVFRGLAPLRSVSVPSCSSKILLLQPLQKSLLLLVAQEGLVQLLPLTALTSAANNKKTEFPHSPEHPDSLARLQSFVRQLLHLLLLEETARLLQDKPLGSIDVAALLALPATPGPPEASTTPHPQTCQNDAQEPQQQMQLPEQMQQLQHLPVDGSSIVVTGGRCCVGGELRLWQFHPLSRSTFPFYLKSSVTAVAAAATRGAAQGLVAQQQQQQQRRRFSQRQTSCTPQCVEPAAICASRELRPKRSLTTQQVASRHLGNQRGQGSGGRTPWLPLHSSQVVAAHWSEPLLLLSTRTQLILLDALHLSEETARLLQDKPLGSIDVAALLALPATPGPPEPSTTPHPQTCQNDAQEPQQQMQLPEQVQQLQHLPVDGSSIVVTGGRCCVGGELRLWQFHPLSRSTFPFYLKSSVTAVAAAATRGAAQGLVAAGTEEGTVILLALLRNGEGILEPPLVSLDRQISPPGHVSCFRLISLPYQLGERGTADAACSTNSLLGSRGPCDDYLSSYKPASFLLDMELLATLHVPFATPPKLLQFGQTSVYQDQLLVTGPNAPPSVFSIPEGRLLDAKALDSFVPLSLPAPLVLGPEGSSRYSDDALHTVLHETFARGSRNLRVLPAPILVTASIGSSKLCLAYESERRILLGMQVSSLISKQEPVSQQLIQEARNATTHGTEDVRTENFACSNQQKPSQASRFHRGAGLASLFRDLGRVPVSESTMSAAVTDASKQCHPKLSWNSETPSEPFGVKRLEDQELGNEDQGTFGRRGQFQEKHNLSALKDASHRFLYRAAEHQNSFEVEVVLPGGTIENVRREFATNSLLFSGRLNDPSWRIQLPGDPATCRLRLRVPLKFRISSNAVTIDQNFANGHIYVSIQR
ncbi:uncharacterized protein EMH_0034990 [Eimeria mitis]|uniref:Uncharacterized protein n=1 Tax=Eimeria mitis TaxID=44415 RepID=U6JQP1_9EIME|nr:uncharacterized protein EMH_0034990 [Eimeria mitis]CDJ27810.1 hypothetical protein, conserved [Eimeria mitis]